MFGRRWPLGMEFSRRYSVVPSGTETPVEWIATTTTDRHHRIIGYSLRTVGGADVLGQDMARDYLLPGEDGISGAGRLLIDFARDVFDVDLMEDMVVDSLPMLLEAGS